jgi:hypothetical protein
MWLQSFMPVLASEVAQACVMGCPVEHVSMRGYDLEILTHGERGRFHIDYRYPQKHFLVQVTFYRGSRVTASAVQRFVLPSSTLMAMKLGASGEKALHRLAAEVTDWLEEVR